MSEEPTKPWWQFRLVDLFVLTTLAALGVVAYQLGVAARPEKPVVVAILATGGTISAFVAYLSRDKKRTAWTIVLLLTYIVIVAIS
jgi:hypothetical protein